MRKLKIETHERKRKIPFEMECRSTKFWDELWEKTLKRLIDEAAAGAAETKKGASV